MPSWRKSWKRQPFINQMVVSNLTFSIKIAILYSYAHHVVASSHSLTRMVRNKTHTIAVDKHLKQMHILFLNVWHQCVCVLFLMN